MVQIHADPDDIDAHGRRYQNGTDAFGDFESYMSQLRRHYHAAPGNDDTGKQIGKPWLEGMEMLCEGLGSMRKSLDGMEDRFKYTSDTYRRTMENNQSVTQNLASDIGG